MFKKVKDRIIKLMQASVHEPPQNPVSNEPNVSQFRSAEPSAPQSISLMWCDADASENNTVNAEVARPVLDMTITGVTTRYLFGSDTYIEFLHHRRLMADVAFLVVSGRGALELLDRFDEDIFKRLDSIFIFSIDLVLPVTTSSDNRRVVGTYTTHAELINAIDRSVRALSERRLVVRFYHNTQRTARTAPEETKADFFWMRVVRETLANRSMDAAARNRMLDRCRLYYRREPKELARIDEFERKYRSDDILRWYTSDSFVYRMLNKALRSEDLQELEIFSPVWTDLSRALKHLHKPCTSRTIEIYRGSVLQLPELHTFLNSMGAFCSFNSFLSTTRDMGVAEVYASCPSTNSALVPVVFHIKVLPCSEAVFADVSEYSHFKDEEEVLFNLNTVFRLHTMTYLDDKQYWLVELVANQATDVELEQIFQSLFGDYRKMQKNYSRLNTLMVMGEYNKAYELACLQNQCDIDDLSGMYSWINLTLMECDYRRALDMLTRLHSGLNKKDHVHYDIYTLMLFKLIGNILFELGERDAAAHYQADGMHRLKQLIPVEWLPFGASTARINTEIRFLESHNWKEHHRQTLQTIVDGQLPYMRLITPTHLMALARSSLEKHEYAETLDFLESMRTDSKQLILSHSPMRASMHLLFASTLLHLRQHDKVREHLRLALDVAEKKKSRSCATTLACYHLLSGLLNLLEHQPSEAIASLPRAHDALSEAKHYINVPNISLMLWNICQVHKTYHGTMPAQARTNLEEFMLGAFQVCELDKILEGKSATNVYRSLLHYAQGTLHNSYATTLKSATRLEEAVADGYVLITRRS